ncbi:MAG: JAB domain-containing protein [Cyclobacteriaceae bacterium]|nr:JAB domain-containing protein [Cyclobacteriaceae bacterium]
MLATEITLSYKNHVKASLRPKITSSKDAYDILINTWADSKIEFVEHFKVLLLNRANKVLGLYEVSTGGISGTVVDPKLIFAAALKANSSSIIMAHNHRSGNLDPSQQDKFLTTKIKQGGQFLDLPLIDHLIVTSERYHSFADEGLL